MNLFAQDGFIGWIPRVDAVNADPGVLIRGDNLLVDEKGALALRPGTELEVALGSGSQSVNNMLSTYLEINDVTTKVNAYAVGDTVYSDIGGGTAVATLDGSDDIHLAADLYNIYMARGTTKKRFDGTNTYNWTVDRPAGVPTLAATAQLSATVATCSSTESPGWDTVTKKEGTISFDAGYDGTANAAVKLVPDSTSGRAMTTLTYSSAQDFSTIQGYEESDDDLIDLMIYVEEPTKIKWFRLEFGVGSDSDPFQTDVYSFEWELAVPVSLKSRPSKVIESATVDEGHDTETTPTVNEVTDFSERRRFNPKNRIPEDYDTAPQSMLPRYAVSASPMWTHLSVPRGKFTRKGQTNGRNWSTVKAVRIISQHVAGITSQIRVDQVIILGGGDRAFTGTYRCRVQAIVKKNGLVIAKSPPSEASAELEVFQKGIRVTVPSSLFQALDEQATNLWIYLYGGGLDDWYRIMETGVTPGVVGMGLDDFISTADGSNADTKDQRGRLTNWDYAWSDGAAGPSDLSIDLLRSELDALIENVKLDRGIIPIPDDPVGVAGPFKFRMVVLGQDGTVYFSGRRQPGTFMVYHTRLTDPEPLWLKQTPSGLYIGTKRDVYRVIGEGNIIDDYTLDFAVRPLGVPHPPVDACVWAEGNDIVYRSADGLILLTGETIQFFPTEDIEPLWRGIDRHEVSALNVSTGRFRIVVDNQIMYLLAPEGDDTDSTDTIYRYSFVTRRWTRTNYPYSITSLGRDAMGGAFIGTTLGKVYWLDVGTQDDSTDISYEFRSRYDNGGNPLAFKDAFDVQIGMDTGSRQTTIRLYKEDGSTYDEITGSTSTFQVFRANVSSSFGAFRNCQVRIFGSSYKFILRHYNVSFRPRPQHTMALDTGYVQATRNGDLAWIKELEITCRSGSNLTVTPYMDDVAQTAQTVTVTAGVTTVYRVPLPRGTIGYKARFKIETTASDGSTDPGFECYSVRMRIYSTGNKTTSDMVPVYPLQEGGR